MGWDLGLNKKKVGAAPTSIPLLRDSKHDQSLRALLPPRLPCHANCFLRLGVRRNKPFFPEIPLAEYFITAVRNDKSTQHVFLGSSLGNIGQVFVRCPS